MPAVKLAVSNKNCTPMLSLTNGMIDTQAMGIYDGGTLSGSGTVIAAQGFNNNGGTITAHGKLILVGDIDNPANGDVPMMIVAAHGDLQCFGALTDDGTPSLQAHSVASLEAVDSQQTVSFDGSPATLVLRSPGAFAGSIKGFAHNHEIVVEADVTGIVYNSGVLTVHGPGNTVIAQLQVIGNYDPPPFNVATGFPGVITV